MLTKRANILFEQKQWEELVKLAKAKNTSVGQIVREAVHEKHLNESTKSTRAKAIEWTLKNRVISKGKIDYKELINHGRKY